ncbi:alpha/beta hydrolase [Streptomyces sp. NBC_00335]|uniref:alpha/beta hydrolase n=1 Tax=unclassified Streptomyces TaxID=2593676 RepID=UPI00225448CD|nr:MULTISPECIES: alpha/beta hydrolase [unclassified Streptomyces]MCX5403860.1 alpha/beta hydrolase [Streptomyces sp. NBC_00086]
MRMPRVPATVALAALALAASLPMTSGAEAAAGTAPPGPVRVAAGPASSGPSPAGPLPPGPAATARLAAEAAGADLVARRAAAVAALAGLPGPAGVSPPERQHARDGLEFGPCPVSEGLGPDVRCGTLRVPVDYARPFGAQTAILVSRVAATGAGGARRQGALVYNPGGPGGNGLFFPLVAGLPEWRRVGAAYDLVGYAPRGVGRSGRPLSCQDPERYDRAPAEAAGARPDAAAKETRIAAARAYARGCGERAGAALGSYTTLNNVRDLHVLRAALGEGRLTFMGASYGTYLGAVYATLYPGHVRRMVFDSAVDPDPDKVWYRNNLAQAPGFERRWADFRAWAARHHAVYGLGSTAEAVQASYDRVRAAVAREPAGGVVGTGQLHSAYLRAAYYDEVWPGRAAALAAFLRGDPRPLLSLAAPDPSAAVEGENATAVYTATLCNDAPWPADWESWDRDNTELARTAPFETWANAFLNLPCAFWPVRERQRPVDVGPRPGAPLPGMLIVAAERDGATPYGGALELQRRLGPRAGLVTETGAGTHGVVGGRNDCVDAHVERYLLTGDTAGSRVTCAPHPEPAPVSLDDRAATAQGHPRALLPPVV